jgi:hypothetical protein
MCLNTVHKVISAPKEGVGWKVFECDSSGKTYFAIYQGLPNKIYPVGEWLKEMDYRDPNDRRRKKIYIENMPAYPFGFHIFSTKQAAQTYLDLGLGGVIKKVKYRRVVATGTQTIFLDGLHSRHYKTIIAKEMMIVPEEL